MLKSVQVENKDLQKNVQELREQNIQQDAVIQQDQIMVQDIKHEIELLKQKQLEYIQTIESQKQALASKDSQIS